MTFGELKEKDRFLLTRPEKYLHQSYLQKIWYMKIDKANKGSPPHTVNALKFTKNGKYSVHVSLVCFEDDIEVW